MRVTCFTALLAATAAVGAATGVRAQTPGATGAARQPAGEREAADLAAGWALLAKGQAAPAAKRAAQLLAERPRSVAALSLAVEAALVETGPAAGLAQYERWLGQRTLEEPGVLRRIATAALGAHSEPGPDAAVRVEALRALAADGDRQATAALSKMTPAGDPAATRARAAAGDAVAVETLVAEMAKAEVDVRAIYALGTSGSKQPIPALIDRLTDQRPSVRRAAVDALAALGGAEVIARLQPMLSDADSSVRLTAAGALYRLGDDSGLPLLQGLLAEPSAQMQLAAAEAMAARPDEQWRNRVRELTANDNPEVRVRAARLIAAHDPALARSVLDALASHDNPVIRELTESARGDVATSDLGALRQLLGSPVPLTVVRAAARVLVMTR